MGEKVSFYGHRTWQYVSIRPHQLFSRLPGGQHR